MTRIEKKFAELKTKGQKALIPFFFAGDPDIKFTRTLVLAAEKAGADIIELGIPYTDPLADGPINQAASARALKNGIRLKDIFKLVGDLRRETDIPIVFLLYFNCVLQYGMERFLTDCVTSGVDGLVIPDLPYEERLRYQFLFGRYPVDVIAFVTPASYQRIQMVVKEAQGFVYCVTSAGVTGIRKSFDTDFQAFMGEVAKYTDTPRVLGFGISTPEQVRKLKQHTEGIIVGSAIVRKMAEYSDLQEMVEAVEKFIAELKAAF